MAWQMNTEMMELCSCNLLCPCFLGPAGEPDQGWCSGALVFNVEQGSVDGVDVSGCRVVLSADWPSNFFAGNGTARLYIDQKASPDQRRELESVFTGKKGGLFEGLMGAIIAKWLPAMVVPIDISRGDTIDIKVGDVGRVKLKVLADPQGQPVSIQGMPAQLAFQSSSMNPASSNGTQWSDPDMRSWEGDSATLHRVSWQS